MVDALRRVFCHWAGIAVEERDGESKVVTEPAYLERVVFTMAAGRVGLGRLGRVEMVWWEGWDSYCGEPDDGGGCLRWGYLIEGMPSEGWPCSAYSM